MFYHFVTTGVLGQSESKSILVGSASQGARQPGKTEAEAAPGVAPAGATSATALRP
jgi:hypothetical protein